MEIIEGIINSIVFTNAENGWSVLRLDTIDGVVTVAGNIPGVSKGERIVLNGTWITHPQYGDQFKSETFEIRPPSGADDVFRYLSSGAIKNIGPAKARDIVEKFGSEALNIIENEPEKLSAIKGVSPRQARNIGNDYRRQAGLRRLINFFSEYNIKPLIATRIYKDYGDTALDAVRDNPYIIASASYGAEFFEADAIALDLGFDSDSTERVSAALVFQLIHNLDNGHTFIPKNKLTATVIELISVDSDVIEEALEALCEYGDIVIEQIAGVEACYLANMHEAESYVAKRLTDMVNASQLWRQKDETSTQSIIDTIERSQNIKYADMQKKALEFASCSNAFVLTGGPGTGKTTTVRAILALFDDMKLKTVLCAPTGRAAKRLSGLCDREAATIHRLLGAGLDDSGEHLFDHDEDNPLDADAVIVDESSMIDILLMFSLLKAMKHGSRLIMVGDADQLPPVGPGSMFSDVIRSDIVPTVALSEIFRQAEDSGIITCAHCVNTGEMPDLSTKFSDLFFMRRTSEEQLAETVAELYSERLPKNMGIEPSQIQVLSPTRKRASGTVLLNELLREKVNPKNIHKKEKQYGDFMFRVGDRVMQIRNNYDIPWESADNHVSGSGIFNGDVGIIKDIDFDKEVVIVDFEDKIIAYTFDQLPELEPAFAMTVHKSQGSEYPAVILAMTSAAPLLLTRSVLYTAMTRAKKLLVIVGSPEVMAKMVSNDKRQRRYSGLRARLAHQAG